MAGAEIEKIAEIVPGLLNLPSRHMWIDYDDEADVLYINFKKPAHADDSELSEDDFIYRYENGNLVGVTILNAGKRFAIKA